LEGAGKGYFLLAFSTFLSGEYRQLFPRGQDERSVKHQITEPPSSADVGISRFFNLFPNTCSWRDDLAYPVWVFEFKLHAERPVTTDVAQMARRRSLLGSPWSRWESCVGGRWMDLAVGFIGEPV
jgi:hypothetical protein